MDKIKIFGDIYKLSRAAAEYFVTLSKTSIREKGQFTVALAGGITPESTYGILATDVFASRVQWDKIHVFFGDERCVPPKDLDSNYRMAREALFMGVPLPEENIHRIQGELKPEQAAAIYEADLRSFFPDSPQPRFDLVFLGMGSDGHTASLFPNSPILEVRDTWVASTFHDESNMWRITLTVPAINGAANIAVLVTGDGKAKRLKAVLEGEPDPQNQPIQLIHPEDGNIAWLLDEDAASLLDHKP